MATWQLAEARSRLIGSRSRNPQLLVRDTVQKSTAFVVRISAKGFLTVPVPGMNCEGRLFVTKGVVSRSQISPAAAIRINPATSHAAFQPIGRNAPNFLVRIAQWESKRNTAVMRRALSRADGPNPRGARRVAWRRAAG